MRVFIYNVTMDIKVIATESTKRSNFFMSIVRDWFYSIFILSLRSDAYVGEPEKHQSYHEWERIQRYTTGVTSFLFRVSWNVWHSSVPLFVRLFFLFERVSSSGCESYVGDGNFHEWGATFRLSWWRWRPFQKFLASLSYSGCAARPISLLLALWPWYSSKKAVLLPSFSFFAGHQSDLIHGFHGLLLFLGWAFTLTRWDGSRCNAAAAARKLLGICGVAAWWMDYGEVCEDQSLQESIQAIFPMIQWILVTRKQSTIHMLAMRGKSQWHQFPQPQQISTLDSRSHSPQLTCNVEIHLWVVTLAKST